MASPGSGASGSGSRPRDRENIAQLLLEADAAQQQLQAAAAGRDAAEQQVLRAAAAQAVYVVEARAQAARIVQQAEEKAAAEFAAAKRALEAAKEKEGELQAAALQKAAAAKAAQERQAELDMQRHSHMAPVLLAGRMDLFAQRLGADCDKCVSCGSWPAERTLPVAAPGQPGGTSSHCLQGHLQPPALLPSKWALRLSSRLCPRLQNGAGTDVQGAAPRL